MLDGAMSVQGRNSKCGKRFTMGDSGFPTNLILTERRDKIKHLGSKTQKAKECGTEKCTPAEEPVK